MPARPLSRRDSYSKLPASTKTERQHWRFVVKRHRRLARGRCALNSLVRLYVCALTGHNRQRQ
jgi:hypothetical protein